MRISADVKDKLPELIKVVDAGQQVTISQSSVRVTDKPRFGTLKDRIAVHDPDWRKPMSDLEADAFLDGR